MPAGPSVADDVAVLVHLDVVLRQDVGGVRHHADLDDLDADGPGRVIVLRNAGYPFDLLPGQIGELRPYGPDRPGSSPPLLRAIARILLLVRFLGPRRLIVLILDGLVLLILVGPIVVGFVGLIILGSIFVGLIFVDLSFLGLIFLGSIFLGSIFVILILISWIVLNLMLGSIPFAILGRPLLLVGGIFVSARATVPITLVSHGVLLLLGRAPSWPVLRSGRPLVAVRRAVPRHGRTAGVAVGGAPLPRALPAGFVIFICGRLIRRHAASPPADRRCIRRSTNSSSR
jgi:hypothetical protein